MMKYTIWKYIYFYVCARRACARNLALVDSIQCIMKYSETIPCEGCRTLNHSHLSVRSIKTTCINFTQLFELCVKLHAHAFFHTAVHPCESAMHSASICASRETGPHNYTHCIIQGIHRAKLLWNTEVNS